MTECTKTSEVVVAQINRRVDNLDKRLSNKLDDVQETLSGVRETLAVNTESLSEHMKRTAILEERQSGYDAGQKAVLVVLEDVKKVMSEYSAAKSIAKVIYKPTGIVFLIVVSMAFGLKAEDIVTIIKSLL